MLTEEKSEEEKINLIIYLISCIGAIIITTAIIHSFYTQILPLDQLTAGLFIFIQTRRVIEVGGGFV